MILVFSNLSDWPPFYGFTRIMVYVVSSCRKLFFNIPCDSQVFLFRLNLYYLQNLSKLSFRFYWYYFYKSEIVCFIYCTFFLPITYVFLFYRFLFSFPLRSFLHCVISHRSYTRNHLTCTGSFLSDLNFYTVAFERLDLHFSFLLLILP